LIEGGWKVEKLIEVIRMIKERREMK